MHLSFARKTDLVRYAVRHRIIGDTPAPRVSPSALRGSSAESTLPPSR